MFNLKRKKFYYSNKQMNKLFWWLYYIISQPTYSSGLLQGNVFNHKTFSIPL